MNVSYLQTFIDQLLIFHWENHEEQEEKRKKEETWNWFFHYTQNWRMGKVKVDFPAADLIELCLDSSFRFIFHNFNFIIFDITWDVHKGDRC